MDALSTIFCVILMFSLLRIYEFHPQSYFGTGLCLSDRLLYSIDKTGVQMCLDACFQNKQCKSVNYKRKLLLCQLNTIDSQNYEDYVSESDCINYSLNQSHVDNSDQCSGDSCPYYHTCIKLSQGTHFCLRTECAAPPVGNGVAPGIDVIGGTRKATCDNGYELDGGLTSATFVCESDGNWNGSVACQLPECPDPTAPPNGTILSGNATIGSARVVECNTGYAKIGGQESIICQNNQVWTAWTGTCKTCNEPIAIPNSVLSSGGVTVGSQRNYTCINGYLDNGQSGTITCGNDASWSSSTFDCQIVDCGTPTNVSFASSAHSTTTWNSTATYSCDYGYVTNGSNTTIKCLSSGNWSAVQLECTFPKSATFDFEDSDSYNFIDNGGDIVWKRKTGETLTSDTGPSGAFNGIYYMYFETSSPALEGHKASMKTDVLFSEEVRCVDFYYSMYGSSIGTLKVKQNSDLAPEQLLWNATGDKGNSWHNEKILINLNQPFRLVFEAFKDIDYFEGDIAVDYIRVLDSEC